MQRRRFTQETFRRFLESETSGGLVLMGFAALGMAAANSALAGDYTKLFQTEILGLDLLHWINDGLMAVFFLLVGLEIKREMLERQLDTWPRRTLPLIAAFGGMLLPALFFMLVNAEHPENWRGWAIPTATDIAFALGVLSLLGPRIPLGLKVFLTALAIVDDMGAVVVIALFYSDTLHLGPLAVSLACGVILVGLNATRIRRLLPFLAVGIVLWFALHESGIHATIAGVVLALTIPVRTRINAEEFSSQARDLLTEFDKAETGDLLVITSKGQQEAIHALERASEGVQAPLLRLEHGLQPLVQYGIMPLFAFANAGVRLGGGEASPAVPVTLGVLFGLALGKPLGIMLFSWLAVRLRLAALPAETSWRSLHGAAWLGGIGFTMSLFIAAQAFAGTPLLFPAKLGILLGSTLAGSVGAILLGRKRPAAGFP